MSTGIVEVPILDIVTLMAAPIAIPFVVAGAAFSIAGSLTGTAANYTAKQLEEMERERRRIDRERRTVQEKEIAAISKKLDRLLTERHKTSDTELSEEFIAKNRASLLESLKDIAFEGAGTLNITKYSSPAEPESPAPTPNYEELAKGIFNRLKILDPSTAKANEQFISEFKLGCSSFRAKIIWENLKISYANSLQAQSKNIWRKKKIAEMASTLEGQRADSFSSLISGLDNDKYIINDTEFTELIKNYAMLLEEELRIKHNSLLAEQTEIQMRKLGYTPVRDSANTEKAIFFNTPDPEYRIMTNVNSQNGQLSFRFVRVVASEMEKKSTSSAQKRRDKEKAEKWCENSRRLIKMIEKASGINLAEIYRHEPTETSEVLIIVDKNLQNNRQQADRRNNVSN